MPVFSLHKTKMKFGRILIAGVLYFYISRLTVHAQDDLGGIMELKDEMNSLQGRFQAAMAEANSLLSSGHEAAVAEGFFNVSNPLIWVVWVILAALLLFFFALRRAVLQRGLIDDSLFTTAHSEAQKLEKTSSLVKPVKVVTIKVRKVKKKIHAKNL